MAAASVPGPARRRRRRRAVNMLSRSLWRGCVDTNIMFHCISSLCLTALPRCLFLPPQMISMLLLLVSYWVCRLCSPSSLRALPRAAGRADFPGFGAGTQTEKLKIADKLKIAGNPSSISPPLFPFLPPFLPHSLTHSLTGLTESPRLAGTRGTLGARSLINHMKGPLPGAGQGRPGPVASQEVDL